MAKKTRMRHVVRVEVAATPETDGLLRLLEVAGHAHRHTAPAGRLVFDVAVVESTRGDLGESAASLVVDYVTREGHPVRVRAARETACVRDGFDG